jgi:hypothetical protein
MPQPTRLGTQAGLTAVDAGCDRDIPTIQACLQMKLSAEPQHL